MRKVELRMNEKEKFETIKNLVEKGGNKDRACVKLSCTIRTINRLIITYKEQGKYGFVHGNRDKMPSTTKEEALKDEIIALYNGKYQDANFAHFKDLLLEYEDINVSYNFIYTTLMNKGITSPKIQKKIRKRLAITKIRKENPDISEEKVEEKYSNEIELFEAHPRQERSKYFGELIQMDASEFIWFGSAKSHLHVSIDDATGIIPGAYFDTQETLNGYYNVFKMILETYGIPYKFLTDNRTVFNYNSKGKTSAERDVLTQFGYACKTFGTDLDTTSVAQAKGRAERLNETLQSRLPIELRLAGITTIEEANKFLKEVFIPKFNKRFALDKESISSVFETIPSKEKINETLAILDTRKVDNGNSIRIKGKYYQLYKNDKLVCFKSHTECLVIKCFDGTLLATVNETVYELKELLERKKISENIDIDVIPIPAKVKEKYIPPMTHPWKTASYKQQLEKAHREKIYA